MPIKLFLAPLFTIFCLFASAQKKNDGYFLLFDKDNNTVKEVAKADYFLNVRQLNDTTWRYDYYNIAGPRLRTETFKDEEGTIPHGRFAFYSMFGYLDSVGEAFNGKRHGDWAYYSGDDKHKLTHSKTYNHGKLESENDYTKKTTEEKTDDEVECTFNGSFKKFLEKNLQFPERAQKLQFGNVVVIFFVVNRIGEIHDPYPARSVEYSLDHEAERVIKLSSGKWKPGYRKGQPVNSYHMQSINFALQEEEPEKKVDER